MKAQGGAVAVWASSGFTGPESQAAMDLAIVSQMMGGEAKTLGEATIRAKAATTDQDVKRTWILFGDPATRIR